MKIIFSRNIVAFTILLLQHPSQSQ